MFAALYLCASGRFALASLPTIAVTTATIAVTIATIAVTIAVTVVQEVGVFPLKAPTGPPSGEQPLQRLLQWLLQWSLRVGWVCMTNLLPTLAE